MSGGFSKRQSIWYVSLKPSCLSATRIAVLGISWSSRTRLISDAGVIHTLSSSTWHANNDDLEWDDSLKYAPVDVGIDEKFGKSLFFSYSPLLTQGGIIRHSSKL